MDSLGYYVKWEVGNRKTLNLITCNQTGIIST